MMDDKQRYDAINGIYLSVKPTLRNHLLPAQQTPLCFLPEKL